MEKVPYTLYAEMTPNPSTMKFVANKLLVDDVVKSYEFTDRVAAKHSPIATKLFTFPFVSEVYIAGNFVTVKKNNQIEWEEVSNHLRTFILEHLQSGEKIVNDDAPTVDDFIEQDASKEQVSIEGKTEPTSDLDKQIINVLDEYVRPAVANDGGAIEWHSFNEGILKVILRGSCSGCPSSTATLKNGIESLMTRMVPEVKQVEAVNG